MSCTISNILLIKKYQLIEYNKQTYPERGGYTKSIIDFWVARHSEAVSDILTVEKDGSLWTRILLKDGILL